MEKSADAFRTISEVAEHLDVPQHVLRFWETRFPQIRPLKRAGGRRYYRPVDVVLLGSIRQLLYDRGYTIKGVQRLLKEKGPRGLSADDHVIDHADLDNGEPVEMPREETGAADASAAFSPVLSGTNSVAPVVGAARLDHATLRNALAIIEECERVLIDLRGSA